MIMHPNILAFMTIAECGTVSAAAKKLGLTQTAATQRIKALEKQLGFSLFLRSRTGMKLTEEGRTLLRSGLQARELEGRLASELRMGALEHDASLAITAPGGIILRRIIPQCAELYQKWPRLNLRFISEVRAERVNLLKSGVADLAVVLPYEVTNELDSKMIAPNELVMVATPRWRDRRFKKILNEERLISYTPEDPLGADYLREYNLLDELKRPRLYANENEAVLALVLLGVGFALLPLDLALPYIKQKKLIALNEGRAFKIPFALAWYPRPEMPAYFRELIQSIR